jgi:hypothetical protein
LSMNSDEPLTFHHVFIIISLCLSIAALFIERDLSLRIHEMFVTSTLKFGLLFPVVLIGDLEGTIYVGNSLCTSIGREKKKKNMWFCIVCRTIASWVIGVACTPSCNGKYVCNVHVISLTWTKMYAVKGT